MAAWVQTHPSMIKINPDLTQVVFKVDRLIHDSADRRDHLTSRIERHTVGHSLKRSGFHDVMADWTSHIKEMHANLWSELEFVKYCLTCQHTDDKLTLLSWTDGYFLASKSTLARIMANLELHQSETNVFQRMDGLLEEEANPFLCTSECALTLQMKIIVNDLKEESRAYVTFLEDQVHLLQGVFDTIEGDLDHSDNEDVPEEEKHSDILQVVEGAEERRRVRKRLRRGGDGEAQWMRDMVYSHKLKPTKMARLAAAAEQEDTTTSMSHCPED